MRRRARDDRGQSAVEYAGVVALLLFVALAAIQLGLVAYTAQQAGTASRAAARVASQKDGAGRYEESGRAAMSDWLADRASITEGPGGSSDEVRVTVRVKVPALLPVFDFGEAERSTTMPLD
ncbi:TadE/TadG family type IV pilus assembly protein [Streptomyces sp. NPDC002659]|uniref:TadE/TadG family type IV pilus assembly protein n=1 Tax=Streptomyces sp. NPDC002659 TaxID=3364656 RepID=UPI0036C365A0